MTITVSTPYRARPFAANLLLLVLFIAVSLPAGSIFGLNVKILVFLAFIAAFLPNLATSSIRLSSSELIGLALLVAAQCLWSVVAILNGQSDVPQVFLQMKDITSTILIAWLSIFFVRRGLLRSDQIVATVVYGIAALSILKLVLVAGMFSSHIDPVQILGSIFGEESLESGSIAFNLTRIEFPSDITGSFALFAILCPSVSGLRFRRISILLLVPVLVISGLLAYSRYLWFLAGFAIISALVIERRFKSLAIIAAAAIVIALTSYETLQPVIEARFLSEQTSDSDVIRVEESRALFEEAKIRPFFGKGLGTHVNSMLRNEQTRYSYELQWMSFLMQFGIVGIAGILVLIHASARDLLASRHRAKPWMLLLFGLWLLSSWTNPYLTSSFAGATFAMFMAMFYRMRHIEAETSEMAYS